jgi:hypothetical protein
MYGFGSNERADSGSNVIFHRSEQCGSDNDISKML